MLCEATELEDAGEALEMVRGLLDSGMSPNARGWDGWEPLYGAARDERWEIVRLLLDHGGECAWPDVLPWLAQSGPMDIVRDVLGRSGGWECLIELRHGEQAIEENPIEDLIYRGDYERLGQLWDLGLNVLLEAHSSDLGRTPLMDAADRGDLIGARWLLDKGANVNAYAESCDSYTALDCAVHNLDVDMARWLLGAGANPNFHHGYSLPLERATREANNLGRSQEERTRALEIREMMLKKTGRFPRPMDHRGELIEPWPPVLKWLLD